MTPNNPRRVALAGAASLESLQRWDTSAGDLTLEVVAGLAIDLSGLPIDALFVAAPAAGPIDDQGNPGAILADRLALPGRPATYTLDAGDGSGAAALHAAYAHVAAGIARVALVIGIAKVSDRSERERATFLDRLIDREVEGELGLTYQGLAGLLADRYLAEYAAKRSTFAHVVAKNAANAFTGGETFLKHAPSAQEILRDIPVAPPLVRSDFAPLFDGATAVLVTELGIAREVTVSPVEILSVAGATDVSVIGDRPEPLRLDAVARAGSAALERAGGGGTLEDLSFAEIHSACSLLEVLAVESLGWIPAGQTGALYADGFGRLDSPHPVNPGGGAQGRGHSFGVSGLEQAREAFLQLGAGAEKRPIKAAANESARALAISMSGLGTEAYATVFGRLS